MFDHDQSFLDLARMIMEGKNPPKKDKVEKDIKDEKSGKESAEETLAKVKKDLGVEDDPDKKRDGEKKGSDKGNEDGSTDEDDHPSDPDSAEDETSQDAKTGTEHDQIKKKPKTDLSKDPFKGEKPDGKESDSGEKDAKEGSPGEGKKSEKAPQASKSEEDETDPVGKDDASAGGQKSEFNDGERPKDDDDDDEGSEGGADDADGAKIGKKSGEEDPDGDDSENDDNDKGKSNGDEVDGSSKSEINLTPVIKDEPISEDGITHHYHIIDGHNNNMVVGKAKTLRSALRAVDRRDNAYGAYRYRHKRVEGPMPGKQKPVNERDTSQPAGYGGKDGPHSVEYYDARERDKKASWHYKNAGKNKHASLSKGIHHDYQSELLRRGVKDSNGNQKPLHNRLLKGPAFSHFLKKEETEMTVVDKVMASRSKTRALMEERDDQILIQDFLDEGFPGSIPGEWYLDEEGMYHVAVLAEDGLKDFVFEKHIGFKKLEGELGHEKGVKNPGALAAYIGRKKYGAKKMASAAKAHKAL